MSTMQAARKPKGKIRPPKKHGPETSVQETWAALTRAIKEIQNENAAQLSFEENYRYAYNLVLFRQGKLLYDGVQNLVAEHLNNLTSELIVPTFATSTHSHPVTRGQECELLMKALRTVWDKHESSMSKLSDILRYMDRTYSQTASVPPVLVVGRQQFLDHVLHSDQYPVKQQVATALIDLIQIERDNYAVNGSSVKGCIDVYLQLEDPKTKAKVYYGDLEPLVLADSRKFYDAEAERLLRECDAAEYLRRVEARLDDEAKRAHYYLSPTTASTLRDIVEKSLLAPHLETILSMEGSGLNAMIDRDGMEDLRRLYKLYFHYSFSSGGPSTLRKGLKESIQARGKAINESTTHGKEDDGADRGKGKGKQGAHALNEALGWVQATLNLKDKFDKILKEAFAGDKTCETAMVEAFESFINVSGRTPEYISLFIDHNLKAGLKTLNEEQVDLVLEKTITLFRFISEKDAFERYYKGHLARRLLHGRSVSDDAERGMLARLKVECGFQFTKKMEGMFNDMKLSTDIMSSYKDHLAKTTAPAVDLNVTVMTSTFWPTATSKVTCNFPTELLQACSSYEHFYHSRHSGRRLTWQPALGNADIRTVFKARKYELNVSTIAMVILLLFESVPDDDFLTYEDIKASVGVPDVELQRQLQSLACAKFKVLRKHPPGREVSDTDSFSFNVDFTSSTLKIKISTIASKVESTEERKETTDRIEEERKQQADACIVRVMKDRKVLSHNELLNEAARQLSHRFQPDPAMIKRRIDALIEREYLERRPDKKSYAYLA